MIRWLAMLLLTGCWVKDAEVRRKIAAQPEETADTGESEEEDNEEDEKD